MTSLAEQIAELINPCPQSADPEEDVYDETKAKLESKDDCGYNETTDNLSVGLKRIPALEGMGAAYRGKVVSRNAAAFEGGSSEDEDNSFEDEDESDNNITFSSISNNTLEYEQRSESGSYIGSEEDEHPLQSVQDGMDEEIDSDEADGEDEITISMKQSGADLHAKQKAARNQICLWENMLEARIKCQKILTISNQLPRHQKISAFDPEAGESFTNAAKTLTELLVKWHSLEKEVLNQNPQFSTCSKDEENCSRKRKMKFSLEDWNDDIDRRFSGMRTQENKVLKLWYDKTRLSNISSSKFSSFERSTVDQIEDILKDKERLLKRTQLKRSSYRVLGSLPDKEKQVPADSMEIPEHSSHLKEFDSEIFDDDDFYHQMLRQLIEQKTASGASNPVELTRQWINIQRLRSKVKKKVDTKASKGRKIRYEIHKKLVSFMAPNDQSAFTDDAKNILFRSLFGRLSAADK